MTTPGISDPPINYWTTSTYDAADQQLDEQRTGSELNSSTSSQFQYDPNGNRILETKVQGASTLLATYLWDPSNRLAVVQDRGYVLTNTYRPDGMRHRTVDNFTANVMVRDKNDVLATVDDTGDLIQFFTRGVRAVKRYNSPTSAMFYHCDALGTMQAYSKPDGTTFERVVLDAWGGNAQAMSVDVHSYVGDAGYWGVGGLQRPLYYVRARWLVAGGPGWLSPDPLAQGANLFGYVGNRPTVAGDPSGMRISLIIHSLRYYYIRSRIHKSPPAMPRPPVDRSHRPELDHWCDAIAETAEKLTKIPFIPEGVKAVLELLADRSYCAGLCVATKSLGECLVPILAWIGQQVGKYDPADAGFITLLQKLLPILQADAAKNLALEIGLTGGTLKTELDCLALTSNTAGGKESCEECCQAVYGGHEVEGQLPETDTPRLEACDAACMLKDWHDWYVVP